MFTTTTWTYLCYKFKLNNKAKIAKKKQRAKNKHEEKC